MAAAASTEHVSRRILSSTKKTTVSSTEIIDGLDDAMGHAPRTACTAAGKATNGNQLCWGSVIIRVMICVACGVIFGISLHKANVMDPIVIRRQMLMQQFTMLKFFMSALATSMLSLSVVAMLPFSCNAFRVAWKDYFDDFTTRGVGSSIVGGALMGLGMTISGSCSSSIFPQLGARVPNAQYTLLGALVAVLIYGLTKPIWDEVLKPKAIRFTQPWRSGATYFFCAVPFVIMCAMGAWAFELFVPSESEIKLVTKPDASSVLAYNVWPPYVCGLLVGALQLPLVVGVERTLGGSTSMSVIVSQPFVGPLKKLSPYLANYRWGFGCTWQIYYAAGAVLGGYVSASASGTLGTARTVGVLASFWGGFLLYLGTRIGGGCTSGHGLSGLGLLSFLSLVMIASTFGTAISSALVLHSFKLV